MISEMIWVSTTPMEMTAWFEVALAHGERQEVVEVRLADDRTDQRVDDAVHEGVDHRLEREAEDECHGDVDKVARVE